MTEDNALTNETHDCAGQSRAVGLFLLKRYKEAADVYDALLKKDPENTVYWVNRMICRLQQFSVGTAFFDQMIRRVNQLPAEGYLCLAEVLKHLDRKEEALIFVNKALEKSADNVSACVLKALLLFELERGDELFAFMDALYSRLKKDERVLCLAAFYAGLFENKRQVRYLLRKALKINRAAVIQDQLFYTALSAVEKKDKVVEYGLEALEASNENICVLSALAQAYVDLEKYEDADTCFQMLSDLTELSEEKKIQWSYVLLKRQDYSRAFDLLLEMPEGSEARLLQMRELFWNMQQAGLSESYCEKAEFLSKRQNISPETMFLCDMVLNRDRKDSVPSSFVRLINDTYAQTLGDISLSSSYFGPSLLKQALEQLDMPFAQSLNVADLGCGAGAMAAVLRNYSDIEGGLTGVDLSSAALERAAERPEYTDLQQVDLVSFCKSRKQAKQYDLIVCMDVFSVFSDLTPVFKAIKPAFHYPCHNL